MHEQWAAVPGFEDLYQVSSDGRVRRDGHELKPYLAAHGYYTVTLTRGPTRQIHYVHRLVARAFLGEPIGERNQVCHNNGIPTDNRLENLRWGTARDNMLDRKRHGRDPNAGRTHCPRNHPYNEANTYVYKGKRECRACKNARDRRRRREAREAAA